MSGRWYYGRGRGWGGGSYGGMWPGNGPFRDLPPWERPGWLYGPGSCWTMGYWGQGTGTAPPAWTPPAYNEVEALKRQKDLIENQLKAMQQTLEQISRRLEELGSRPAEE
ncbi:MAG: hypothetical protein K9W43_08320 [Candidatus Thorarchaeota archaeon]|nr:hypothetical protein [Candidatus Thorarchaeota archaeon]